MAYNIYKNDKRSEIGSSGRPSAVRGTTDTLPTRKLRNFYFEHE